MLTFAFLVAVSVSTAAAAVLVPLAVAADQLVAATLRIPTATITSEPLLPATLYGTSKACETSVCVDYINACGM
jgi:hypothetical protein